MAVFISFIRAEMGYLLIIRIIVLKAISNECLTPLPFTNSLKIIDFNHKILQKRNILSLILSFLPI